jgi:hypothetical protein
MQPTVIAPSILSANFARLGDEVDAVLAAGADWVHFDVMDNHYVPNLTIGPLVCEALRKHGVTAPIDVHLMVEPVDRIVPDFAQGRRFADQLPSRSQRARGSHDPADQVAAAARPAWCSIRRRRCEASGLRAGRTGSGAADVGEPGLRRSEFYSRRAREAARGARTHRCRHRHAPARSFASKSTAA